MPTAAEIVAARKRLWGVPLEAAERMALHRSRSRDPSATLHLVMDLLEVMEAQGIEVDGLPPFAWVELQVAEVRKRPRDLDDFIVWNVRDLLGGKQWAAWADLRDRVKRLVPHEVLIRKVRADIRLERSPDGRRVRLARATSRPSLFPSHRDT